MSFAQIWNAQYPAHEQSSPEAIEAWCSVRPEPADWYAWLETMRNPSGHWGQAMFDALGQDNERWLNFLQGASQTDARGGRTIELLNYVRVRPTEKGSLHEPLPLACLEALLEMAPQLNPRVKEQLLLREPSYWFGFPRDLDPAGLAPLHRLAVNLLCTSGLPDKRLPSLQWSPSALYDDYGQAPTDIESMFAPIQHALEYAVYAHATQRGPDPLAHAELHAYFEKHGLELSTFETLIDLSQASRNLASSIGVLHAMLAPEPEHYPLDMIYDSAAP